MKLNLAVAATVAGLLLATAGTVEVYGGWFCMGDSSKSADAKKAAASDVYNPNRIASGPKIPSAAKKNASGGGWFGLGRPSANTQPSKESLASLGSKPRSTDKNETSSWWSSMFKSKEPSPPKSTGEWMKLKPVRW